MESCVSFHPSLDIKILRKIFIKAPSLTFFHIKKRFNRSSVCSTPFSVVLLNSFDDLVMYNALPIVFSNGFIENIEC